jgi:hypothetical protein
MDEALRAASAAARAGKAEDAVADVDRALKAARSIREARNRVLRDAEATWEKTWMPRVKQANGRTFLQAADDVKDHLPARTVDMSYLVYRELLLPLDSWYEQTQTARNTYASAHGLELRSLPIRWKELAD